MRKFPIDALKIDQSFVRQISSTGEDTAIVTAVISMGRSLKLRVVAESVETREELEFLQAHQCDEAQGYYFIAEYLHRNRPHKKTCWQDVQFLTRFRGMRRDRLRFDSSGLLGQPSRREFAKLVLVETRTLTHNSLQSSWQDKS